MSIKQDQAKGSIIGETLELLRSKQKEEAQNALRVLYQKAIISQKQKQKESPKKEKQISSPLAIRSTKQKHMATPKHPAKPAVQTPIRISSNNNNPKHNAKSTTTPPLVGTTSPTAIDESSQISDDSLSNPTKRPKQNPSP